MLTSPGGWQVDTGPLLTNHTEHFLCPESVECFLHVEPSQEPTEGIEFYYYHLISAETEMVLAMSAGWIGGRQGWWDAGILGAR